MRLYIDTMDAVLVEFGDDGRVRFEDEEWTVPTLQERRAILHSARTALDDLRELVEALERDPSAGRQGPSGPQTPAR